MNRPNVLVLLAAHNGGKWIAEQIESILRQSRVDVALVISDDLSNDDTRTRIERYADARKIRLNSPPTRTGFAAQNFLWLICNTDADGFEYVALSDQDDIWLAGKLERGCAALRADGASGYSGAVTAFWEDGSETILNQTRRRTSSDFLFEGAGQGCTFILTSDFYCRLKTFLLTNRSKTQGLRFHDWAIYALSRSWGLDWKFDQTPMMRYRQHQANDIGARASARGLKKRLVLIKEGWYAQQIKAIAQLCLLAAPEDPLITEWNKLLVMPHGVRRRWQILLFCIRGGRRRKADNGALMFAAVAGWI
jgi:rhamnosyltransferase